MDEKKLINELESIITYADGLKAKAEGLRKKLVRLHAPASPKGAMKKEIEKVLQQRERFLTKKALRAEIERRAENKKATASTVAKKKIFNA